MKHAPCVVGWLQLLKCSWGKAPAASLAHTHAMGAGTLASLSGGGAGGMLFVPSAAGLNMTMGMGMGMGSVPTLGMQGLSSLGSAGGVAGLAVGGGGMQASVMHPALLMMQGAPQQQMLPSMQLSGLMGGAGALAGMAMQGSLPGMASNMSAAALYAGGQAGSAVIAGAAAGGGGMVPFQLAGNGRGQLHGGLQAVQVPGLDYSQLTPMLQGQLQPGTYYGLYQ